jgi:hypothetical protein
VIWDDADDAYFSVSSEQSHQEQVAAPKSGSGQHALADNEGPAASPRSIPGIHGLVRHNTTA